MNAASALRLAGRLVAILLLAVAIFGTLEHEVGHQGDLNCPVCLQAHAGSPALVRQIQPLELPQQAENFHSPVLASLLSELPITTHAGRAPPSTSS